jgi:ketosteroid isomerase-like protein
MIPMRVLAAAALAAAILSTSASPVRAAAQVPAPAAESSLYTCGMHPGVARAAPGKCPVCSMTLTARPMTAPERSVVAFFKDYDAAFVAKDMTKLATMYTADTTVFDGGGASDGWKDYRDNHLGLEMKEFADLRFAHTNVVPHVSGDTAFVTAAYTMHAKNGDKISDGGGLATYTLIKEKGAWKITHTHTSAKRK